MNEQVPSHTVWQTLAYHLIPGALLTAVYFAITPLVMGAGYPALAGLFLCILVILVPVELGILLYQGRKQNGRLSLKDVVLNREPIPLWQYFVFVPLLLVWSAAAFLGLAGLDNFLLRTFFAWMPAWSTPAAIAATAAHLSRPVLLVTVALGFAMNGIAGPVVEELYFRGFLLPRIPASKTWAPLINVVLFSLYHFFSPWQFVTRVALFPMVYVVAWKRNLYLSMITHCLLNTLGMLSLIMLAFR